ncbi:MAG: extracellular solute-binding protein [Haloarculaceae archaeon]
MDEPSGTDGPQPTGSGGRLSRRRFVAVAGVVGAGALAGCPASTGDGGDGGGADDPTDLANFRGSGPLVETRGQPGGTSITELPDLSGELTLYLGGGEGGLYMDLIELFGNVYPEFDVSTQLEASANLANTIVEESEAGTSPADVFMAVDAGSLGAVAEAGAAASLPSEATDAVPAELRTDEWVGFAGRARAIPYNTEQLSGPDVPETVQEFPEFGAFEESFGWAPTYSAFQSFVTAMRLTRGADETRDWLLDMRDLGAIEYNNEFLASNAVADGEIAGALANHYYALRVRNSRGDAPVDLAFTSGDAGALINVSGATIIEGTDDEELAVDFLRHLLSAEAQEFFATRTFAYPTVPGVEPVGGLPSIDELNPPDVDLAELANVDPTLELLRETDVL